jgi:hypothetical protein
MDVVVVHPVHQDLETATSKLGVAEHLVGDVGVDEGVEEDVGVVALVSHDDLVDLSELLEDAGDVRVVQLCPLIGRAVRVGREQRHRDADDGQVVAVAQSLIPQLVDQVGDKGLVVEQPADAGLLRLLAELRDLLVTVDLSHPRLTMENTEEKRRLTVDLFLS